MRRWLSYVAAAVMFVAGLVGCSDTKSGQRSGGADPTAVVTGALTKLDAARSASFSMEFTLSLPDGPITTSSKGVSSFVDPLEAHYDLMVDAGRGKLDCKVVMTPDAMFTRNPPKVARGLGTKPWIRRGFDDIEKVAAGRWDDLVTPTQHHSPLAYVRMLAAARDMVANGKETIRGEETTRYSGSIKPSDLANAYTGTTGKYLTGFVKQLGDTSIHVDAHIGADGLPRRIYLMMRLSGYRAETTTDLAGFGVDTSAQPPAQSQTTDLMTLVKRSKRTVLALALHPPA